MTRRYSRRAALAALGAGLVGLTGAAAPEDCRAFAAGQNCASGLSLSGPDAARLSADASDPRFVLTNDAGDVVRVTDATWTVYRLDDGWERVATDRSNGATATLAPSEETAWAVLLRADEQTYTTSTTATDVSDASSTTRYVGPVSLSPGAHAFVVAGRVDGGNFEAVARFDVE